MQSWACGRAYSRRKRICVKTKWQASQPSPSVERLSGAPRSLWVGLLGSLTALPPAAAAEVVSAVHVRLKGAGASVPPRLRAQAFGDIVLTQVQTLLGLHFCYGFHAVACASVAQLSAAVH